MTKDKENTCDISICKGHVERIQQPDYVGRYQLGDDRHYFNIMLLKKPNIIHRFFMQICLGWQWIDHPVETK